MAHDLPSIRQQSSDSSPFMIIDSEHLKHKRAATDILRVTYTGESCIRWITQALLWPYSTSNYRTRIHSHLHLWRLSCATSIHTLYLNGHNQKHHNHKIYHHFYTHTFTLCCQSLPPVVSILCQNTNLPSKFRVSCNFSLVCVARWWSKLYSHQCSLLNCAFFDTDGSMMEFFWLWLFMTFKGFPWDYTNQKLHSILIT